MNKKLLFSVISLSGLMLAGCGNAPANTNDGSSYVTSVSMSQSYYTFENVGETFALSAEVTVLEGKEYTGGITWRTSESKVASVDNNGFVVANGGGECYITAIAGYKAAVCKITVRYHDETIGEFSLQETKITLKTGTTTVLHPYLSGSPVTSGVIWDTTNNTVASVENGVVKGESEGTATITAKYSDKTATCVVTVSNDAEAIFTITLDRKSETLLEGASTTLVATTSEPATVSWTSSDPSVASVDNGVVTALKEGTTTITATANEESDTCVITVNKPSEDDEDKVVQVNFYIDFNNVDKKHPYKTFPWYQNVPLAGSSKLPSNPTEAPDPAFPYFVGWSTHTIVDTKDDLWNMETDSVDGTTFVLNLYGIWSDVEDFNR